MFIHYILEQVNLGSLARDGSPLLVTENVTSATTTHVTKVSKKKYLLFRKDLLGGLKMYIYMCFCFVDGEGRLLGNKN